MVDGSVYYVAQRKTWFWGWVSCNDNEHYLGLPFSEDLEEVRKFIQCHINCNKPCRVVETYEVDTSQPVTQPLPSSKKP